MQGGQLTVIVALAMGLVGCGQRAVGKATTFLKNASTVRVRVQSMTTPPDVQTFEIACPDRVRAKRGTPAGSLEIVAIGDKAMARTDGGRWVRFPLTMVKAPGVCRGAPWVQGKDDLATILEDLMGLQITEVPIHPREVSGTECQDWEAREAGPDPQGTAPRIRLCLAVDDYRLMQLVLPDASWTFSDWNVPMDIQLPAEAPPVAPAS
jgi:hypothetical protein